VIEIRHLRYFVAVSEELHFGRAAERLHITQPPLSQAIRKLEDDLGVELLHRTSRVVTLTQAGEQFAAEARRAIAAFDRAVAGAQRAGSRSPTLHVGCVPFLPVERLLTFLAELRRRSPGIAVQVSHLYTNEQLRALREGTLDVGVFTNWTDDPELEARPIFAPEPFAAFLAHGHPLAAEPVLTPEHLRSQTLVTMTRSVADSIYDIFLERLAESGYVFADVREAGGSAARDLFLEVAEGSGVAVNASALRHTSEAARLVACRPLSPPLESPEVVLAWTADVSPVMRPLVATLRAIADDLRHAAEEAVAASTSAA
jgi:DNA-binding transcriptional LysR family regulator